MYAAHQFLEEIPDNVVAFPGGGRKSRQPGHSNEVFALKRRSDVANIQRYFLEKKQWRNYLFVVYGVTLGLRGSDIVKLAWRDLFNSDMSPKQFECAVTREQKTGKFRYLVVRDDLAQATREYLNKTGITPVFNDPKDPDYFIFRKQRSNAHYGALPYITRNSIGRIISKAAHDVGIPYRVNTHSLRKTFGYNFFKSTGDIIMLQKILNHATPQITLRYIGVLDEEIAASISSVESIIEFMSDEEDFEN